MREGYASPNGGMFWIWARSNFVPAQGSSAKSLEGWGIYNGTPPYRVPGYLSVDVEISCTGQSQTGPGLRLTRQGIDRLESCRSTSTAFYDLATVEMGCISLSPSKYARF